MSSDDKASTVQGVVSRTEDDRLALAQALEQKRAEKIVEDVAALPAGGKDALIPTPFQSGYQLACEEILHRLKTEKWEFNVPEHKAG